MEEAQEHRAAVIRDIAVQVPPTAERVLPGFPLALMARLFQAQQREQRAVLARRDTRAMAVVRTRRARPVFSVLHQVLFARNAAQAGCIARAQPLSAKHAPQDPKHPEALV